MASTPSTFTFPLFKLPSEAILQTMRVIDLRGILSLSLTSKRSEQFVISSCIKATSIGVRIGEYVTIEIENSRTDLICLHFPAKQNLIVPESVFIHFDGAENLEEEGEQKWKCSISNFQNWLKHLWAIFHYEGIEFLEFYEGSDQFDLQEIKEIFGKFDNFSVRHTESYAHNHLILQEFFPITSLSIETNVFEDSKIPSDILIQHFEGLLVYGEREKLMNIDHLLLINAKQVDIMNMFITPKDFNKFLKLWIKGAAPQLEYLYISFADDIIVDENELMRGINHHKIPLDRTRIFNGPGFWEGIAIKGGFDFYRKDGLKATISVTYDDQENYFRIFVWQETCNVIEV